MMQALPPPTVFGNFALGLLDRWLLPLQRLVTPLREQRPAQPSLGSHSLKPLASPPTAVAEQGLRNCVSLQQEHYCLEKVEEASLLSALRGWITQ